MSLRHLFVDMNAFFASVEKHDDPALRDRPVAVVAVDTPSTCCLSASYEARDRGVRTGMGVWEARQRCPGLVLRVGRPGRYTEVHHQIVRAVGKVLPVSKVMSIDEMACRLIGDERHPDRAAALGRRVKQVILDDVGPQLRSSVGVGPNVMLAKVASDMHKPDGLTLLPDDVMPAALFGLKLTDFPGIGPRMERRLNRVGIHDVRQLVAAPMGTLARAWGSKVHAERWYHTLRGAEVSDPPDRRRTVGHSHVLAPALRTDAGARSVLVKLVHKAAARLRGMSYYAGAIAVGVRYEDGGRWHAQADLPQAQDTLAFLRAAGDLWTQQPDQCGRPKQVWMVLLNLKPARVATPSLFPEDRQATAVSHVMDAINRRFGKDSVRFGTMCGAEETAPTRISFNRIPAFNPAFG